MVTRARSDKIPHRTAAMAIGVEKVRAAKNTRGPVSVITGLDHVVVLTGDIAAGTAAYQTLFARTPAWTYSGDGADRALFTLDNMTLELVAPDGEGPAGDRIRARAGRAGRGTGEPLLSHR